MGKSASAFCSLIMAFVLSAPHEHRWMGLVVNKIGKLASASRKPQVSELAAVHPSHHSSGRAWRLPMNGAAVGVRGIPHLAR